MKIYKESRAKMGVEGGVVLSYNKRELFLWIDRPEITQKKKKNNNKQQTATLANSDIRKQRH